MNILIGIFINIVGLNAKAYLIQDFVKILCLSRCALSIQKFILQECMKILDVGAREALNDVVNKVLKRLATTQFEGKEEDLDDTLLN